jgi:hypothetical protein
MFSIEKCPIPANTLLDEYLSIAGAYVDCYTTDISKLISFPEYIRAFYTTPPFKLERLILKFLISKPSTDLQAKQVANGEIDKFAAWTVEKRSENELLMCDVMGRTRSWLMTTNVKGGTKLYFGSAVIPKAGSESLGFGFQALLRFHQIYSALLLASARSKLTRRS